MKTSVLFGNFFGLVASLLKPPREWRSRAATEDALPTERIVTSVRLLRCYFDYIVELEDAAFSCFTCVDWAKFVMCTVLGVRLSFSLDTNPDYDAAWARSQLRLGEFMGDVCGDGDLAPATKMVDVLSASKVVMRMVKQKYDRRVAALEVTEQQQQRDMTIGCPMIDGSLSEYVPVWDADFSVPAAAPHPVGGSQGHGGQPMFQDLWATMTMGWPSEGETYVPDGIPGMGESEIMGNSDM